MAKREDLSRGLGSCGPTKWAKKDLDKNVFIGMGASSVTTVIPDSSQLSSCPGGMVSLCVCRV